MARFVQQRTDGSCRIRARPPLQRKIQSPALRQESHDEASATTLGAADVSRFLSSLADDRHVSASTQNQALKEVSEILRRLSGPVWLMAWLMYGSGLRLLESAQLRVKDLDFATSQILLRASKGQKDRMTLLPAAVAERRCPRSQKPRGPLVIAGANPSTPPVTAASAFCASDVSSLIRGEW